MCRRATCPHCHRPTYVGCGRHIEQVLGDVPEAQRCHCRENNAAAADQGEKKSWWQRLFG